MCKIPLRLKTGWNPLLRVEFENSLSDTLLVRLEGRLVGNYAHVVRNAVAHREHKGKLVVELSEVIVVDEEGEELLLWLRQTGAEFLAESSHSRFLCDHLQLPLATEHVGSSRP